MTAMISTCSSCMLPGRCPARTDATLTPGLATPSPPISVTGRGCPTPLGRVRPLRSTTLPPGPGLAVWPDQAWRDPWVFRNEGDWEILITAPANHGPADDRGVIAHAISGDLLTWEVQPPLSEPGQGFGQLEVPQVEIISEVPFLFFSCLGGELARSNGRQSGGIWVAEGKSLLGTWDIRQAQLLTDESLYAGRAVKDRAGDWMLMAIRNISPAGEFIGEISDPLPLTATPAGR